VTLKPWETRGFSNNRPLPSCVGSYVIDSDIFTEDIQAVNVANRVATFTVVSR
jgi:hypothetical protein